MEQKSKEQIEVLLAEAGNNEPILTNVRKVRNGKFQIEVAEKLPEASTASTDSSSMLLSLMNASDDRFSQGAGARRAWLTVEANELKKHMGIDVNQLTFVKDQNGAGNTIEVAWIGLPNPRIGEYPVAVQIIEGTSPFTSWQAENQLRACKKSNADTVLLKDGKLIFTDQKIAVKGSFEHKVVLHDQRMTITEYNRLNTLPQQELSDAPVEVEVEESVKEVF